MESPATEARNALAALGRLEFAAPGGARVVLDRVRFADVAVSVDAGRALVFAVVEGEGRVELLRDAPEISYVGREAFAMERCPGRRWCLAGGALPALRGVVAALAATPPPAEGARRRAWQIRVEREGATAGEDWDLGGGAARHRSVRRLARDGEGFRIAPAR